MTQDPQRIVVTGSSRGLGLEFVRQYAADGHRVFALARRPGEGPLAELAGDGRVTAIACDVTDPAACAAAVAEIGRHTDGLEILINNAGMAGNTDGRFGELDLAECAAVIEVNALAPIRMSELCLPLLRRGAAPRIVHVTSRMGSIADNGSGGWWAYRMSKAALNMACKNMALELRGVGVATMVLHPGWVRTDMGGAAAPLSPEDSVCGMREQIAALTLAGTGRFVDYAGSELPW